VRSPFRFRFARVRFRALVSILLLATPVLAQTVRPLLVEYQGGAHGQVEYINDSFHTINVILEAKGFEISETGAISYTALPSSVHLKLSTMSFRLAAKQAYTVYYDAKADAMPAWFVLYADFAPVPQRDQTGMTVHIRLPHTVYLLPPKAALKKSDLTIQLAAFHPKDKKIIVEVANSSGTFGRVLSVEAVGHHDRADMNGFPVFPNSKRRVELDWKADEAPEKLVLRLDKFTLQQPLTATDK
jgi:hypothetical protein